MLYTKHDNEHPLVLNARTNRNMLYALGRLPCGASGRDGRVLFGTFHYELGEVGWDQGVDGDLE